MTRLSPPTSNEAEIEIARIRAQRTPEQIKAEADASVRNMHAAAVMLSALLVVLALCIVLVLRLCR